MSYSTAVISVLIASPSDVIAEREAARDVIHDWNNTHAGPKTAVLLPIGWDTHTSPELGKPPQEIINERVLRDSDLLVGIFWQRLGTPTGGYPSGSVEEIRRHIDTGKPALVYFSEAPPAPDADQGQLVALGKFKEWCRANGLPRPYKDSNDFERHFARDLQLALRDHPYLRSRVGAVGEGQSNFGTPTVLRAPAGSTLLGTKGIESCLIPLLAARYGPPEPGPGRRRSKNDWPRMTMRKGSCSLRLHLRLGRAPQSARMRTVNR